MFYYKPSILGYPYFRNPTCANHQKSKLWSRPQLLWMPKHGTWGMGSESPRTRSATSSIQTHHPSWKRCPKLSETLWQKHRRQRTHRPSNCGCFGVPCKLKACRCFSPKAWILSDLSCIHQPIVLAKGRYSANRSTQTEPTGRIWHYDIFWPMPILPI